MDIASDSAHPPHAMKHALGLIVVLGSLASLGIVLSRGRRAIRIRWVRLGHLLS
jgi:hypothetical protein